MLHAKSLEQPELFARDPVCGASPVGFFVGPHPEVTAAVLFPIPALHLCNDQRDEGLSCQALVASVSGRVLVLELPQASIRRPDLWEFLAGVAASTDEASEADLVQVPVTFSDLAYEQGWPLRKYESSRQFRKLVERCATDCQAETERGPSDVHQIEEVRQSLIARLRYCVSEFWNELARHSDAGSMPASFPVELVNARPQLRVNVASLLCERVRLRGRDALLRARQACRLWPTGLLRTAVDPNNEAVASDLICVLSEGRSVVHALERHGLSRSVIRRVMRDPDVVPDLSPESFLRLLRTVSTLSPDAIPTTREQWMEVGHIVSFIASCTSARAHDIQTKMLGFVWRSNALTNRHSAKERVNSLVSLVRGWEEGRSIFRPDDIYEAVRLILSLEPDKFTALCKRIREKEEFVELMAVEHVSTELSLEHSIQLIEYMLETLPVFVKARHGDHTFRILGSGQDLHRHGQEMDTCLADSSVMIQKYLSLSRVLIGVTDRHGVANGTVCLSLPTPGLGSRYPAVIEAANKDGTGIDHRLTKEVDSFLHANWVPGVTDASFATFISRTSTVRTLLEREIKSMSTMDTWREMVAEVAAQPTQSKSPRRWGVALRA